jgi:hypothetical protein
MIVLALAGSAMADVFDFTYTSSIFGMDGYLTATSNGDGSYTATQGQAVFFYDSSPSTTYTLTLLVPGNEGGVRLNAGDVVQTDNLIFPNDPYFVDFVGGIAFTVTGGQSNPLGGAYISNNTDPPGTVYYGFADVAGAYVQSSDGVFNLAPVPEPSSAITLLTALIGVGFIAWRRGYRFTGFRAFFARLGRTELGA